MNNENYIEGARDTKYGGIITDITKLPVGTKFYVCNGCWYGTICEGNDGKYISVENGSIAKIDDNVPCLLSIREDYVNSVNDNSVESPCNKCMESYCYKNCDNYTKWQTKAETIMKAYNTSKLDKFLIAKEVIEDGRIYEKTCNKKQYICPTCGNIISRQLCIKANKPKYCYECGQLLVFKGE